MNNTPTALLLHTASLFLWDLPLDDRIHLALDAGLDGVEISDGPGIVNWQPHPETVRRLRRHVATVHAELFPEQGITLGVWAEAIARLPIQWRNAVFHPDELGADDFARLADLPFPASIENMDPTRDDWRTVDEVRRVLVPGVGLTLDTAHTEENGLSVESFRPLFIPQEMHLSAAEVDYYDYNHALVHLRPDAPPQVVSGCPLVTLEGVVPAGGTFLADEVRFVREAIL